MFDSEQHRYDHLLDTSPGKGLRIGIGIVSHRSNTTIVMSSPLNFRITWRYLIKDRLSLILNVAGLSTGLTCAVLIYLWVNDELKMDRYHAKGHRLYHLMENRVKTGGIWTSPTSSSPTAAAFKKDYPEVENAVTIREGGEVILTAGTTDLRASGKYVSLDFFELFTCPLIAGNPKQALAGESNILISEKLATALFGNAQSAIGKQIERQHEDKYFVSGVFGNSPKLSSTKFDYLLPFEPLVKKMTWIQGYGSTGVYTYLTLKPGVNPAAFNKKIAGFVKRISNGRVTHRTPFITLYANEYLYGEYENGVIKGGRIDYVRLFSIIAIFILVIACINFMNLSTAKAAKRAKEVGIKKVVGARRGQLILQYLGESLLITAFSALVAVVIIQLVLPGFNELADKELEFSLALKPALIILGITIVTGLIAGSYPALYLSGFQPGHILKGKIKTAASEMFARKGLVIFQFTLSVFLIIAVVVVYKQIKFVQNRNLGYDKENVLTFWKEGKLGSSEVSRAFLQEVKQLPTVVSASTIGHDLTGHNNGTSGIQWPGRDPKDKTEFEVLYCDYDLLKTLGINIKEGRDYSPEFGTDTSGIILNEAGVKYMEMKDPVGKQVSLWGGQRTIVGVVKDFNFESLHKTVGPAMVLLNPESWRYMIRVSKGKDKETIAAVQKLYTKFNPGFTFDYSFLDENLKWLYAAEERVSILSRYFAGLAIGISCLGLFGLTAFTAQRRQKEISIRKVIGATESNIVMLLSKDFLWLVLIAILVAFPLSWWAVNQWLKRFAYRTDVTIGVFVLAAAAILIITILTISIQSLRAARANPVKNLKND